MISSMTSLSANADAKLTFPITVPPTVSRAGHLRRTDGHMLMRRPQNGSTDAINGAQRMVVYIYSAEADKRRRWRSIITSARCVPVVSVICQ